MIPLDSSRWKEFDTYFGTATQLPQRIKAWRGKIGSPEEGRIWPELSEQFLHQGTITDAAFAVVPYVVKELSSMKPQDQLEYLVSISIVESARNVHGASLLPSDLADAYNRSIKVARKLSVECLKIEWPKIEFRYVMSVIASLHGHGVLGDIIFNLDSLCGKCPKCQYNGVYPEEIQESGYVK